MNNKFASYVRAHRENQLNMGVEKYTSDAKDAKGRVIGLNVYFTEWDAVADESGTSGILAPWIGRVYHFAAQTTRDGTIFGGSQTTGSFKTSEECIAAATKAVENFQKRNKLTLS